MTYYQDACPALERLDRARDTCRDGDEASLIMTQIGSLAPRQITNPVKYAVGVALVNFRAL